MTTAGHDLSIVVDGHERARAAIRLQVFAEYESRWQQAGWFEQLLIWREIEREVDRRAEKSAPPYALY